MIDTHGHLNFEAFVEDYREVIARSEQGGIKAIVNVGSQFETSAKALRIAEESKICFASIGVHPIHSSGVQDLGKKEIFTKLSKLAENKKVVAIGETGLDYYHLPPDSPAEARQEQKELFRIHLEAAEKKKLPIILHCRNAYEDLLEILPKGTKGVIHCFCGSKEIAQKFLNLGFYIGFTGMITYPGNQFLEEAVKAVPLEKILAETDCPYLAPQAKRGERNEPLFVRYVILKIAEVLGLTLQQVEQATDQNARRLFELR